MDIRGVIILITVLFFHPLLGKSTPSTLGQETASRAKSIYFGETSSVVFPQVSFEKDQERLSTTEVTQQDEPPLELLKMLEDTDNFEMFLNKYVGNLRVKENSTTKYLEDSNGNPILDEDGQVVTIEDGLGTSIATSNKVIPQTRIQGKTGPKPGRNGVRISSRGKNVGYSSGRCKPVETTLSVDLPKTEGYGPHLKRLPSCVRVHRCGGCCGTDRLACEPKNTTIVKVQVLLLAYNSRQHYFEFFKSVSVDFEKHLDCDCGCRIKPEDCSVLQEYNREKCSCVCSKIEEELACRRHANKRWNSSLCKCECREIETCSSGLMFDDQDKCQCIPI